MLSALLVVAALAAPDPAFRVLVYSRTAGFRHDSIPDGIAMLQALGAEHGFAVEATEDPTAFTDEKLATFAAVVFLSTTGDILDRAQEQAFERFVEKGGGYVGIHAAADTEYDWPWYGELVGGYFKGHPRIQKATIDVVDRTHPSTAFLPERWERTDEWYNYRENPRGRVHVLMTLDESSYEGGDMGGDHPIAWCRTMGKGRSWYTGGGHTKASFAEPDFRRHVLEGLRWAAGRTVEAELPGQAGRFDKVVLDDFTTDPMELAVAPDGRVVFVERGGAIKVWSPQTRRTDIAGFVDVFDGLEDGLLGVALSPDFMKTGHLFVSYAPRGERAVNRIARLTLRDGAIDPALEVVVLEWATQRQECCHSGGSLAFGPDGCLYASTGDNTSPFASDGYAPIDERPGREPFDAQKSSANANDLRGKILRIRPTPDGGYEIPEGNLFPPGTPGTRPEIYVMGCRNPFRIAVDPDTGTLYWGEVGPDASGPGAARGPAGHDELNRATGPGNFGWPYFVGENLPYWDYDFAAATSGAAYDPARPVNRSPSNTGIETLPPAQPAWIAYPYGVAPRWPQLGEGGRCAMGGPVVRIDRARAHPNALPAYYDGCVLFYEWARDRCFAIRADAYGTIRTVEPFLADLRFVRPHEMELGPDGRLYVIEWGTGFGGGNPDAQIVRIDYHADGERPPAAVARVEPSSGALPLTVTLDARDSRPGTRGGPLAYAWDLDDDGTPDLDGATATAVFREPGAHRVRLVVRDPEGRTGDALATVVAGNTAPVVRFASPPAGAVVAFGDAVDYRLEAHDAEDGEPEVRVEVLLGHDTHAHPLARHAEPQGSARTLRDDGHGEDADLFTVLRAVARDRGAPGAPALESTAEIVLQPRRRQAEHASRLEAGRIGRIAGGQGDGAAAVAILERDGAFAAIEPIAFDGIAAVRVRLAGAPDGAALELRLDAVDGPLLGAVALPASGRLGLAAGLHPIRVEYFERGGSAGLVVREIDAEGRRQAIAPSRLVHGRAATGSSAASAAELLAPVAVTEAQPGLRAAWYELRSPAALPDFSSLAPYKRGVATTLAFPATDGTVGDSGRGEDVGLVLEGFLRIERDGFHRFSLESDDGSRLYVAGELVVDNDGLHAMTERSTAVRWTEHELPILAPPGTHALLLVARGTHPDAEGLVRIDWVEFVPSDHDATHGAD